MAEREEAINSLKRRVTELREKAAKEYSDEDITQKITDVFNGYEWKEQVSTQTSTPAYCYVLKCLKWGFLTIILLILLVLGLYLAYLFNPYVARNVKNSVHDYNVAYHISRVFRFVSLPFHSFFDMKKLQKWQCIVKNPFYNPGDPNCEPCEAPLEIEAFLSSDKETKELAASGIPTIVRQEKEFKNAIYNYTFIRNFYFNNKKNLDFSVCDTFGNQPNKQLEYYFARTEEEVLKSKETFGWSNCRIEGTRVLRKLFRRPSFVPIMSEIFLEKCLFVVHPQSTKKLILPECGTDNCFIAQVYGESAITLNPVEICKANCTMTPSTELKAGEIFYYPGSPWKVEVEALGENLAIIYRSDFT